MVKTSIALEIETLQSQTKPNTDRIKELQAKLHNPLENGRVRALMAKKDNATRSEVLFLLDKGVTVKDIARNMGVQTEVISALKPKRGKYLTPPEVNRRFYKAVKMLKEDPELKYGDAARIVGITASVLSDKIKQLNLKIPPRDLIKSEVKEAIKIMNEDPTMRIMEASRKTGATPNQLAYRIRLGEIKERVK